MELTQKQERFARFVFEGKSQRDAYLQAGYSSRSAPAIIDTKACQLFALDKIKVRYAELQAKATSASIATVEERKQILTEISRGRMSDYMTVGADGVYFDYGEESLNSRAVGGASSKTVRDEDGNGETIYSKIYLRNPMQAIDLLNKMEKIYSDDKPGNVINIGQINVNTSRDKILGLLSRLTLPEGQGEGGGGSE